MTEKHYGGSSSHGLKNKPNKSNDKSGDTLNTTNSQSSNNNSISELSSQDIKDIKKAGEISKKVKEFARNLIKPGMPLLEIADKIESKIIELGGKPAFPCNLSLNEIAAHFTPPFNDETLASGLLKVDLGVHINGWTADTAFSLDLENSTENKKLIEAAELALKKATETISLNVTLSEIGKSIEHSIKSFHFQPIQNLSGHKIDKFDLHSGLTIPNFDNSSNKTIQEGLYAIEPFSTSGLGSVKDGKPSGIYKLESPGNVRDSFAREVLSFIQEEYFNLPFCNRWIHKKFGSRGLLALRQIEQAGLLHHYPQLIESGNKKVAQAEHTVLITKNEKTITT